MPVNEKSDLNVIASTLRKKVYVLLAVYALMIVLTVLVYAAVIGAVCMAEWLMIESGSVYGRLLVLGIIVIIAASVALWAVLSPAFKIFSPVKRKGEEIRRAEYPDLFNLIDEVVKEVQCLNPKHVYISNECNAYVYNPSFLGFLRKNSRQNLTIGLPLLYGMNRTEFRAILAHEFGHFTQHSVRINRIANLSEFICGSIIRSQEEMGKDDDSYAKYARGYVRMIGRIMMRQYHKVAPLNGILSRAQEFDADHYSQKVAGTEGSRSALSKLSHSSRRWASFYGMLETYAKDEKRTAEDVLDAYGTFFEKLNEYSENRISAKEILSVPTREFPSRLGPVTKTDTHPTDEERVNALEGYAPVPTRWDMTPALDYFKPDTIKSLFDSIRYEIQTSVFPFTTVFLKKNVTPLEIGDRFKDSIPFRLDPFYSHKIFFSEESFPREEDAPKYMENPFSTENSDLINEYITAQDDLDTLKAIQEENSSETVFRYLDQKYDGTSAPVELHAAYFKPLHERMTNVARHCNWWLEEHSERAGKGDVYYILRISCITYPTLKALIEPMGNVKYIGENDIRNSEADEFVSRCMGEMTQALTPFMVDRGNGRRDLDMVAEYTEIRQENIDEINLFHAKESVTIEEFVRSYVSFMNMVAEARHKAWRELVHEVILKDQD